jgi:signal transduction histidine kinase
MAEVSERIGIGSTEARLNRGLRTLYQCSRLLFEVRSEQELLQAICQILAETGELRLAWIGYCKDDAEKSVRPVAMAGYGLDFLERVKFSWGDTESGQGPIGIAIRTGTLCSIEDIRTDPIFSQGRTEAIARGYASCVALPLIADTRAQGILDLRGTLNLYADAHDFFDENAIELYTNLTTYLTCTVMTLRSNWSNSFASEVTVLRNKEERSRAQAALQASEMQRYLMEADKLSALGGLVAGVAHEVNTPIGNSLTVASALANRSANFAEQIAAGQVRRSLLAEFADCCRDAANQLVANLQRAGELVQSFRQVAVDRSDAERRRFDLKPATEQIVASLRSVLRESQSSIAVEMPSDIILDSYPGAYGQVLTNLVFNAVTHGFDDRLGGRMLIDARRVGMDQVEVTFSDDGAGMPAEVQRRVFDPLFTTRRAQGSVGLGLHIVHNIVTQQLGGRITLISAPGKGTVFHITLPLLAPARAASPEISL